MRSRPYDDQEKETFQKKVEPIPFVDWMSELTVESPKPKINPNPYSRFSLFTDIHNQLTDESLRMLGGQKIIEGRNCWSHEDLRGALDAYEEARIAFQQIKTKDSVDNKRILVLISKVIPNLKLDIKSLYKTEIRI